MYTYRGATPGGECKPFGGGTNRVDCVGGGLYAQEYFSISKHTGTIEHLHFLMNYFTFVISIYTFMSVA